ncbi:predicted protein [Streptomyces viridosporus ATCC 14672]|uniref:Predicted protein n=1 Tax=Streptomyces viridosporus (strain ATCC 14672 / DSM 40746 / JCM 4963 / KCTC 9882 / NRRL B-12104 / FH 1290) TaxID=566461 RepID=D6A4D2_STRV1|nr:hypothetical protein [Streptomyces viridosporus]EFE65772.1 predicted protein [Streptomyces viridosporus ATCC 14672]
MARYRKRPVEIEAVQFTDAASADQIRAEFGDGIRFDIGCLLIETLEGTMRANLGDWIVRGVQGELYPVKPDIFAATYEPVTPCQAGSSAPNALGNERCKLPAGHTGRHADGNLTWPAPEAAEKEKTTRVFAALHRSAEEDVTRVIDLYEQWVKAGPPPLGVSLSRWWDARLAELHDAINPDA